MGIFSSIKSIFAKQEKAVSQSFDSIIQAGYAELKGKGQNYWWSLKANEVETFSTMLLPLPDGEKANFIATAVAAIHQYHHNRRSYSSDDIGYHRMNIAQAFMQHLLKTKLTLDDTAVATIANAFCAYSMHDHNTHILYWPVNLLVNQIEKQVKQRGLSDSLKATLQKLNSKLQEPAPYHQQKDQTKLTEKIQALLFSDQAAETVRPSFFPGDDPFAAYANDAIKAMPEADRAKWFRLMHLVQKASGSKPSAKFLAEGKTLFADFGVDRFKQLVQNWFGFITALKEKEEQHSYQYGNLTQTYSSYEFLAAPNIDLIKGLVWLCVHFHDKTTLFALAALAERAFRKIPGKGPAAAAIGNACLYTLAHSKGLDGIGHLSRLKLRIKQSSTQNLIEKYLLEAAAHQGVTLHEIEDMAVDSHGLENGKRAYELEGYTAVLAITGIGKTELSWYKPDGSPQKTEPAAVKEKAAAKLKKIKDTAKQVALTVSAQRDRVDRMFKSERNIPGDKFDQFYFSHGLMGFIAQKMIWNIDREGRRQTAFYLNGNWCNSQGQPVDIAIDENTAVSIWHPVHASVADVKAWRDFMMAHQVVQPLKQAFREVYLLTDAEVNTRMYSNRMAAHILKQHQFNSLAKTRGWKYALLGAYDDGRDNGTASFELKEYGLRAEFWVNEVNAEDAFNDTGIWLYVATDQVRFIDTASSEIKELLEVPALAFSEIMRDVDLFVGVASVGNDPTWRDSGGLPAYRDYWQAYSFGDLNEQAKTRKTILEGLLPRLKISPVAELKDKFLIVKGKLRTYKIHIGSTNILMEPNDQYLCIVPDRGKSDVTGNLFLPFEGDNGLSVILSKAMLLAEDDKITDKTITSQINHR
jgi:hypothetical protein